MRQDPIFPKAGDFRAKEWSSGRLTGLSQCKLCGQSGTTSGWVKYHKKKPHYLCPRKCGRSFQVLTTHLKFCKGMPAVITINENTVASITTTVRDHFPTQEVPDLREENGDGSPRRRALFKGGIPVEDVVRFVLSEAQPA